MEAMEALALISAPGISTYNSPLLGYNSPSESDVSGLIYIDHKIKRPKYQLLLGHIQLSVKLSTQLF